jgi:hypothetical protein
VLIESDVMTGSWHRNLKDWYRNGRRGRKQEATRPGVDIELDALCRNPRRVDSDISIGGLTLINENRTSERNLVSLPEEPINLKLDFGDMIYIKPLDYGTFCRWSAIEELKEDLEKDGMIVQELWDEVEEMRVCSGDWDARVRPGWSLQVYCQNREALLEKDDSVCDSESEHTEDEEESWIDEVLDQYQEEWCLPRWRDRVEQGTSARKHAEEPSWVVLGVGCISIVLFIVAVVVYTA